MYGKQHFTKYTFRIDLVNLTRIRTLYVAELECGEWLCLDR